MTDQIVGLRADTWEWSVTIDSVDQGIFDAKEGGDVDSDDNSFRPGSMGDQYSLGGPITTGNVTLRRNYRLNRDHPNSQFLINRAGSGQATLTGFPLDPTTKQRFGKPFVYAGTLKRVAFPTHDSNAADASMLELEFTITGRPSAMSRPT